MTDYPYLPMSIDEVPDHLVDLWAAAWSHDGIVEAIWYGEWFCCRQLEPPRRPPSWYPGQPDLPRQRVDRCSCVYIRKYATVALPAAVGSAAVRRHRYIASTAFVIDEQCTHHGIAALDHDEFDERLGR